MQDDGGLGLRQLRAASARLVESSALLVRGEGVLIGSGSVQGVAVVLPPHASCGEGAALRLRMGRGRA